MKYSTRIFYTGLVIVCITNGISSVQAQTLSYFNFQTQYITEGRDNLASGGIAWLGIEHSFSQTVSTSVAYGMGTNEEQGYDELNASLIYQNSIYEVEYYIAATHLSFFKNELTDNELSFGGIYHINADWSHFLHWTYSEQVNGFFTEIGVTRTWHLQPSLLVHVYGSGSLDNGYASAEYDGINHYTIGTHFNYHLSRNMAMDIFFVYEISGADIKRETGTNDNQAWLALQLNYMW